MIEILRQTIRVAAACAIVALAACGVTAIGSFDSSRSDAGSETGPPSSASGSGSSSGSIEDSGVDATPCSVDLENDPANCGACAHDCQGGGCAEGMCTPTVFLANEPGVTGVAVAASELVWTRPSGGVVRAMSLDGGAPSTRTMSDAGGPTAPFAIASDGTSLFITDRDNSFVWRRSIDGGPVWSVNPIDTPTGIAFDGTEIFVAIQNQDHVASMPSNGGGTTQRLGGLNYPAGVAVTTDRIFASSGSGIMYGPKDGGGNGIVLSPTSRFQDGGGDLIHTGLAVEGTTVFFTIESLGIVATVPTTGGAGKVLARNQNAPFGIAVTATTVYWANRGDGTLMKVAR